MSMRAIRIQSPGTAEVLREENIPTPAPKAGEALVRVDYAGINFVDVYKRSGVYKVPLPATPGDEGAGTVEAIGSGVTEVKVGDRVAWASIGGSYAEYVVGPAAKLVTLPADVDTRVAAAVMLQGMTAHYLATSTYPLKK